jgi:hypothetical protein
MQFVSEMVVVVLGEASLCCKYVYSHFREDTEINMGKISGGNNIPLSSIC